VAVGVDAQSQKIFGPQRVQLEQLDSWMLKQLTLQDAVVLEMTTNAFQLYDDLKPHVHSVTLVHPPHVALITRAQVMTDTIAALTLARLHAAGLLPPVWVPPARVRDHRALVAHRSKMVRLGTQAKNRLQAVLQRYHLTPPEGNLFAASQRAWWLSLSLTPTEHIRIESDLDTLDFAATQRERFEQALVRVAATDPRVPLLVQLPGFSLITAMTSLAALGDITRFPSAEKLVGYAGLGSSVHDSGLTRRTGRLTKAGRRDIRAAMVEAAHTASRRHPHWRAELARLEPRLGTNKALVAIARKLLISVWHVLSEARADRFAEPELVARKLLMHAYRLGRAQRPATQSTAAYVREQLDRLGLGNDLDTVMCGGKKIKLPPSRQPIGSPSAIAPSE
jgi:transposase